MRTVKPEAGNKYYIRKASGGWNGAVKGKPTDECDVLANCVGYANGRFAEIMGEFKYQFVSNAENFIEHAKAYGLEVGQTPRVGSIMCWKKGASLKSNDGAGHVAIVEKVNSDGTVYTSESGYNSKAFWNSTRSNRNGRWGQNSSYSFRGFIYNPNIKPEPTPEFKVIYQTYDNVKGRWLNEIISNSGNDSMSYAGNFGHAIGGIRMRTTDGSSFEMASHIKNGKWLSTVTKWDDTSNGYSGIKGKAIDGVSMKVNNHNIKYRVHIKGGKWLGWISTYNINDWKNGIAGIKGRTIDAIQIRSVD